MMCEVIFMQPEAGIFSVPLMVCTNYLVTFLIFVGFLLVSGVDRQFVALANSLAGRYSGGPAKVATIGSAFVGMMQGAPSANVAATGSFTIPMMKKLGFEPAVAGAVESCASTGGQLVPPIMGSTAFLIAAFLDISYLKVCYHALIPTFIYYSCVILGVHFYAKRKGLAGLPPEEIPPMRRSISTSWPIFLPFAVLLGMMARGYGLGLVAVSAVISLWIASAFKKETRITAQQFLYAFEIGAKTAIVVTIACAVVGIIIGSFYVSGLGDRLSMAIVSVSGGNLMIGLLLTALGCIVLGMGMVIPAVYMMMVYIAIPALIQMGAAPISAHFFVFMFCVVAAITPPVGLALYVASGIAEANVMDIGWKSIRLGIALFIIPFFIVWDPALLGIGSPLGISGALITALIGALLMESGFEGWLLCQANWIERSLLVAAGILLMLPNYQSDLIGAACGALAVTLQKMISHGEPSSAFIKKKS
jgi:TRAP transporter 4TM/12TM fusion protein